MVYRTELIRRLSRETRLSQEVVSDVLNALEREVKQALASGDAVQLTGFGSFYTRKRAESRVPSIQTGEMMTIPAGRVVGFRAGELLKKAIRSRKKSKTA